MQPSVAIAISLSFLPTSSLNIKYLLICILLDNLWLNVNFIFVPHLILLVILLVKFHFLMAFWTNHPSVLSVYSFAIDNKFQFDKYDLLSTITANRCDSNSNASTSTTIVIKSKPKMDFFYRNEYIKCNANCILYIVLFGIWMFAIDSIRFA